MTVGSGPQHLRQQLRTRRRLAWILTEMTSRRLRKHSRAGTDMCGGRACSGALEAREQRRQPLELESISAQWQRALDAAERALRAADRLAARVGPPAAAIRAHSRATSRRQAQLAATGRRSPASGRSRGSSPVPVTNRMLGLPATARACLFDVEGVLTDSAVLHARAWGEVFDDFLLRLAEKTGWHFIPFDRVADYRAYVDGRSRLEGVHAFLDSRGIRLPEGRLDGPADADTACGLARRKAEALRASLRQRGVTALPGALRYLEAAAVVPA